MVALRDISERIVLVMRHFGLNKNSFSKEIGLTNNVTIGRIVNESRNPSYDVLSKIANTFPVINFNWLLTGEGKMLKSDKNEVETVPVNYVKVPTILIHAQAGFLTGYNDDAYWDDLPTEIWEVDKQYKGNHVVFEVKGDSMDDNSVEAILEGDRILCREIGKQHWANQLRIKKWNFVIVHREEGIIVKRIIDQNVDKGIITCHSLNTYYEDIQVNLKDVIALYNVVDLKRNLRL